MAVARRNALARSGSPRPKPVENWRPVVAAIHFAAYGLFGEAGNRADAQYVAGALSRATGGAEAMRLPFPKILYLFVYNLSCNSRRKLKAIQRICGEVSSTKRELHMRVHSVVKLVFAAIATGGLAIETTVPADAFPLAISHAAFTTPTHYA